MTKRSGWIVAAACVSGFVLVAAFYAREYFSPSAAPPEPPVVQWSTLEPEVAEAVRNARERVGRQPRSAEAWGQLGHLLRAHELYAESNQCYATAEQLDPRDPRWPYLQAAWATTERPAEALPKLRAALELCEPGTERFVAVQLRLAETLLQTHEPEEAQALLQEVVHREPDNARANFDLALAYLAQNKWEESVVPLERATHSPFTRQKAFNRLSVVQQRLGNGESARRMGELASKGPDDLLWVDPFLNEYLEAEVGARSRYTQAERLEQQGRLPQAAEVLRKEATRSPSSRAFVALGIVLAKGGQFAEAEHALKAALEHDPDKIQAHYFLAIVKYLQAENLKADGSDEAKSGYRQAIDSAEEAIKLKPDHGLAQLYLGLAQLRLGQNSEAIAALRAAVQCRPEMAETHLRLGNALLELGETKEGQEELELAARLAPDNTEIQAALQAAGREQ